MGATGRERRSGEEVRSGGLFLYMWAHRRANAAMMIKGTRTPSVRVRVVYVLRHRRTRKRIVRARGKRVIVRVHVMYRITHYLSPLRPGHSRRTLYLTLARPASGTTAAVRVPDNNELQE